MKIIYLLTVFFYLPDGRGIDGNQIDGWSPREHATLEECLERKTFIEQTPLPRGVIKWNWSCKPAPENWSTHD
jgi:hypothetical protein